MKRFLLSLLILAMFTPGMACAQFMGKQKQQQHMSMAGMAKGMPCCPKPAQKNDCSGTMLFKDCTHVDLQHANDAPLIKKFDIVKISYILPQDVMTASFKLMQANFIRGPPDPPEISRSYPPIFLTTQRLRI